MFLVFHGMGFGWFMLWRVAELRMLCSWCGPSDQSPCGFGFVHPYLESGCTTEAQQAPLLSFATHTLKRLGLIWRARFRSPKCQTCMLTQKPFRRTEWRLRVFRFPNCCTRLGRGSRLFRLRLMALAWPVAVVVVSSWCFVWAGVV